MKMGKLVVVTGIDGSGKDYVAQYLHAQDHPSSLISTPTAPFLCARLDIDAFALTLPAAHYFFYLASVIHASSIIEQRLIEGNVYCVRYLIDTVAYHRAMGLPIIIEYETPLYRIRQPDLTVFLNVTDEGIRQERLKTRGKITVGDHIVNEEGFRNSLLQEYQRLSEHFVVIDNTHRDIGEVAEEIAHLL